MNDAKDKDISIRISDDDYEKIFELLNEGKVQDKQIFTLDGDSWSFKQFENGAKVYERRNGHIYGLAGFEKLIIKMRTQDL